MWGDHSLGNNLSLLEGDKKEDRIVVYCSNTGGVCRSGIPVVPKYNRQFDSIGRYAEYVELAVSNEKWVAVRTLEIKNGVKREHLELKNFIEGLKHFKTTNRSTNDLYNFQGVIILPSRLAYGRNKVYSSGVGISDQLSAYRDISYIFNFELPKIEKRTTK